MSDKVRRIAILVTSLDATAGRQLLQAMPVELARQVRRAMTQLGSIDPVEQRQILAEFRMQALTSAEPEPVVSSTTSATNSAASLPTHARGPVDQPSNNFSAPIPSQTAETHSSNRSWSPVHAPAEQPGNAPAQAESQRPWQRLDVETLLELLRAERPPVIAVVLSQLDAARAAKVLEQLARSQQRDVISALSQLGNIDPEAMQAIDEHLASRIADYHHRRASETESVGRMQELLTAASDDARDHWQTIIRETDVQLAQRMGIQTEVSQAAARKDESVAEQIRPARRVGDTLVDTARRTTQRDSLLEAARPAVEQNSLLEMLSSNVVTTVDTHSAAVNMSDDEPTILPFRGSKKPTAEPDPLMPFDAILELPAEQIGQVLASAPTDVILLALAGASPSFMHRFMAMLEKRDAKALQSRLREMRTINLQDVDAAQRRLRQLATNLVQHENKSSLVPAAA